LKKSSAAFTIKSGQRASILLFGGVKMPAFMSLMKVKGAKDANKLKEMEECITRAGGK
jgi:hypothetical protein